MKDDTHNDTKKYQNLSKISMKLLERFYEIHCKKLARAKTDMEKDASYLNRRDEKKKVWVELLEETRTYVLSAKDFMDRGDAGNAGQELDVVKNRLRRVKTEAIDTFPNHIDCSVEAIIAEEYNAIDKLYKKLIV